MQSIAGPLAGSKLAWLPSEQLAWRSWGRRHPTGQVLSTDTGFGRDYSRLLYPGYGKRQKTIFPVPHTRRELPNKDWVAGIVVNGKASAYPLRWLGPRGTVTDKVGGIDVQMSYESPSQAVRAVDAKTGERLPVVKAYWFAWQAFYPRTRLWRK
jgi:hypothetical protein